MLTPVERARPRNLRPVLKLANFIIGDSHTRYEQLDWRKYSREEFLWHVDDTYTLPDLPGNPDAGRLPRNWNLYGVLVAEGQAINRTRRQFGNHVLSVAYADGNHFKVGQLPDNITPLLRPRDPKFDAVLLRIGRGPLKATFCMSHFGSRDIVPIQESQLQGPVRPEMASTVFNDTLRV